jgi:hypothetical protein
VRKTRTNALTMIHLLSLLYFMAHPHVAFLCCPYRAWPDIQDSDVKTHLKRYLNRGSFNDEDVPEMRKSLKKTLEEYMDKYTVLQADRAAKRLQAKMEKDAQKAAVASTSSPTSDLLPAAQHQ